VEVKNQGYYRVTTPSRYPKTLYRYDLVNLTKDKVQKYQIKPSDTLTESEHESQILYCVNVDRFSRFYGFATLKEAKTEYLLAVRREVGLLTEIIKKNSSK